MSESVTSSSDETMSNHPSITTDESTAEPLTPSTPDFSEKLQDEELEPSRKKSKKRNDPLSHLLYIAQWYTNFGDGQDGLSGPGIEENYGITTKRSTRNKRKKTFEDEMYEIQKKEEEKRDQIRLKRNLQLEKEREEEERLRKEENLRLEIEKRELKLKLKAEKEAEKEALRAEKEALRAAKKLASKTPVSITPSPEPTPEPTPEPEPEEFVDGYKPFSYSLEKDIEIPIRDNFFIPQVYSMKPEELVDVKFRSAYDLITGSNSRYYKKLKNFDSKEILLKSTIYNSISEKYCSVTSTSDLQLDPFEEIGKLMELLALNYFPDNEKLTIYDPLDPYSSLVGKYSKALQEKKYNSAIVKINKFNSHVQRIQSQNGFFKHLSQKKTISRVFIHEILNEIYSRSVSPRVNILKKYQAFSSNVYGELLPKFLSQVFDQVGLNSNSIFMDLGSGVGNVTIQAALEYGCESYGCEIMDNCSELGDDQLIEFEERCALFGLNPGKCKFFHRQSFLDNPEVKEVLDKCDVILVNNFLFTPDLKEKTLRLFNNLKPKTKIISLRTILPDSHHIEFDDVDNFVNKFEVCKYEFETNSVSWTAKGGVFYITEFTGLISERALSVFNTRARERKLVIHKKLFDDQ